MQPQLILHFNPHKYFIFFAFCLLYCQTIKNYLNFSMLFPYLEVLNSKKIILGSQSKMRNELMQTQKLKYDRVSSTFAEDLDKNSFETPAAYNLETCRGKVNELIQRFSKQGREWDILICGDTIVYYNGEIIEKPENFQHCVKMMGSLINTTHQVYTANMVVFNQQPLLKYEWVEEGNVTFGDIPIEAIQAYAKTEEPYIHSGGYELTGEAASFIKGVSGSMTSIQGLDVYGVCHKIVDGSKKLGWI